MLFAPLNDCRSIVCGPSTFGPVQVESCILDTGCTSLLLPWPRDPDQALGPLLGDPMLVCGTSLAGSVGSDHATFQVCAPTAVFEVVMDGQALGVFVSELRFVVTDEARRWLCAQDAGLWRGFCDEHVHNMNLDYALVGQTVLSQLVTMQVYNKGLLVLGSFKRPVPDVSVSEMQERAAEMYRAEIQTPHYQKLRDLRDTRQARNKHEVQPHEPHAQEAHAQFGAVSARSPPKLGRRMQQFGVGVLKFQTVKC
jgi:hypothetical protein